ncbi:hypothetical protein [Poinsettia branch-inducing phytoplasma]|uniref:hypothetical protein n=1 Tax=Poinsettia branch-inducing phytoplasma TaxID=138647 RepID=UPI00037E00FD|nr:hypothetical protein [Poinsettia branch-inducing phytoplasma]
MIKIKKIIKWFLLIIIFLVVALIGFIILTETGVIKIPKDPIPTFQETKFENIEEWYDDNQKCTMIKAKYTFDGLNGVGYYEQQKLKAEQLFRERESLETEAEEKNLQSYLNDKAIDMNRSPNNPELDNLSQKIMKNRNELIKINQSLILDRLESQTEPTNLACYIKDRHPFDRWNKRGATSENFGFIDGFEYAHFDKKDDSQLFLYINFEKQQHEGPGNNKLILKYKGPKHFLQEDKDYYLGDAFIHNDNFELTDFHLHFNPIRKTLSIFKDKHNYNKVKEAEIKNRQKDDW